MEKEQTLARIITVSLRTYIIISHVLIYIRPVLEGSQLGDAGLEALILILQALHSLL